MNLLPRLLCIGLILIAPLTYAYGTTKLNPPTHIQIDASFLEPSLILPPAPELESAKGKAELLEIRTMLTQVSPRAQKLAAKDALTKNVTFFADTVVDFDIEKLPKNKLLFNQVRLTSAYEVKVFKKYFMRKRPYVIDEAIKACVTPDENDDYVSYASGHATMGFSMGIILAHLIPEKSAAIMERANQYAENRLICGVHHRSDIIAGQVLGSQIAIQLMQNVDFQKMLQSAKQELRNSGLTN